MLANNKTLKFPIILTILISLIGIGISQKANQKGDLIDLENKKTFYNKVLNSQPGNENVEIVMRDSELFLSAKTDIPESTYFLTLNPKYHFTGCAFFPFRDELQSIFHRFMLNYPRGGNNVIYITTLVYQLLYYRKSDKDSALNIYRDLNKISSEFYKFEMTPEQKEYLDIISLGRPAVNMFNLPKELREKISSWEIDDLIFQTAEGLFYFVKNEIKKLPLNVRNFFESFVGEYDMYMKYFDYVYRFSHLSSFEDFTKLNMNRINMAEFFDYYETLLTVHNYPDNKCLAISPLYDLVDIQYNTLPTSQFNPAVILEVETNKLPAMRNLIQIPKESVIYRIVMQNPSREAFLSDYGKIITDKNLKNNFSLFQILFKKEDFHLPNLTKETIQKNMQIKNCLEFKCLISFDKLLQKGFALEDFNLLPNSIDFNLIAISKISFFDPAEADSRFILKNMVAKGEQISYENELKAFLRYGDFLLRKNKIIKNSIEFLKEFSEMKKANKIGSIDNIEDNQTNLKLSPDYHEGFNYAILAYEKLLVKVSHLEIAAEHVKSLVRNGIKDLKKRYIIR